MVSVVGGNVCLWFPSLFFYGFRRGRKTFCYGFRRWAFGGFCRRRRILDFRMYRAIPRCLCFEDWFPSLVCLMVSVAAGKHSCMVSVVVCSWFPSWQGTLLMVSVVGLLMVSGCYRTAAVSPMETVNKTSGRFRDELSIYIYIYMCIYIYIYMYV